MPAPDWSTWSRPIARTAGSWRSTRERVLGWVALSPYSGRQVYTGRRLAERLRRARRPRPGDRWRRSSRPSIEASEAAGIWSLLAGILVENAASLAAHRSAGFRRVGVQERLGRDRTGRWRDVVLMERRSTTQGIG